METAASDFVNAAGEILSSSVERLGTGLQPASKKAIDALMRFIKVTLPDSFKQAQIEDEASKLGKDAAKAVEEGLEEGSDESKKLRGK